MVDQGKITSTAAFRRYLRVADQLVNQYAGGELSYHECIRLQEGSERLLMDQLARIFMDRVEAANFFRDPVPELDRAASPVSRSDG